MLYLSCQFNRQIPMNSELIKQLSELGLSEKEAGTYIASLELGQATIVEIAKKSGLNRTTIYNFIDNLVNRGLLGATIQGKKKLYTPAEPEKIEILLKQKELLFESLIPQLKAIYNTKGIKPKVKFFEGDRGIVNIFLDNLSAQGEILTMAGETTFNDLVIKQVPDYIERRVKKKIFLKMIVPDSPAMIQWMAKDKSELRETKAIPKDEFPLKVNIDIYNDKVAITSTQDKIGLLIESKDIADTWRSIFKLCWRGIK